MNRAIGRRGAWLNLLSVLGFAAAMGAGSLYASYVSSIFIAFGFVAMVCAFAAGAGEGARAAGIAAVAFGAMYALLNICVYFVQLAVVRTADLGGEARMLLDYSEFGMAFALDLLGYALMAVSTFFAGLTVAPDSRADRWLRGLLIAHGAFAPVCLILPVAGVFRPGMAGGDFIGTAVLLAWCAYFTPVAILTIRHFRAK